MKRGVPHLLIVILAVLALFAGMSPLLAAPRPANAENKPVTQTVTAAAIQTNPIKYAAQDLMTNAQNWLAKKANVIIGKAREAATKELARRLNAQIAKIETPIDRAVKTIKKIAAAKYNSAASIIKNAGKEALQKFDK